MIAHQSKLLTYLETYCTQQGGWISFAEFMHIALYAPGLGYYSAGMAKFGSEGDFVTAPEISPLFSQSIGSACLPILAKLTAPRAILELGAGTGRMAIEILEILESHDLLPEHYFILEVSADLKARQQMYIAHHAAPTLQARIKWLDTLPTSFTGIILANEVIDALPIHLFQINEQGDIQEGYVGKSENKWICAFHPPSAPLRAAVEAHVLPYQPPSDYISEINVNLMPWLKSLSNTLAQGVMLFVDYGFPGHEYYHPSRNRGTLMCHKQHRAHPDPLSHIGLQDITAHVDFTALANAATASGLEVGGFTTQANFLLSNQILTLAQPLMDRTPWQISQHIQKLTHPHEMGELFKVMALTKNFSHPLSGFQRDQRHRL